MTAEKRYFLSTDQDSHWYLVPADKRDEWNDWTDIDPDDPKAWTAPEWASPLGGSPTSVTFTNPRVE